MIDNDELESLSVVRVGERVAIFAATRHHIYRFDTADGNPWPAST
jgi:hypothetical protein